MRFATVLLALHALAAASGAGAAPPPKLPVVEGRAALAVVNGEAIHRDAVKRTMDEIDAEVAAGVGAKQDPWEVFERFVTEKLIAQEARNIGFQEDPRFQSDLDAFRRDAMRQWVLQAPARRVMTPDPADVKRSLRLLGGEAKIVSSVFEKEGDARASAKQAAAGKEISGEPAWARLEDLDPAVASALAGTDAGKVAGPLRVDTGWTLVKVLEWKEPSDPETKARARAEALGSRRLDAVTTYTAGLKKRYAKVNEKLLEALDFEAPQPGWAALKKDGRVLATIEGGESVTIADLTRAIEVRFFHGIQRAIQDRRVNRLKWGALDEILVRRIALLEGKRLGVDRSPEYLDEIRDREETMLFGAFVDKVIQPELRATDEEVRKYFEANRSLFVSPEAFRLDAIAFARRGDAERALSRLRAGADFRWVRENAEGTLPDGDPRVAVDVQGKPLALADLPEPFRDSLARARKGDLRLVEDPEGASYVVRVADLLPPQPLPFEIARESARGTLLREKTTAAIDEWTSKLRAASDVKIHVTRETIRAALDAPSSKR